MKNAADRLPALTRAGLREKLAAMSAETARANRVYGGRERMSPTAESLSLGKIWRAAAIDDRRGGAWILQMQPHPDRPEAWHITVFDTRGRGGVCESGRPVPPTGVAAVLSELLRLSGCETWQVELEWTECPDAI